eukprot:CAMPEP_0183354912 /NCGR_PEP_ID=MMETSP0164_2-20130417/38542_1 /TAXON_ID=221442 /ORGANISM="Coccolithus pelagicus ssp braarudi, Strain PLY182g" /LENGTH=139 /DNA_ID=CAMNT_0025527883 /DNA_START=355 /DNA_END=774 /DNA_ORIENTATION=+
MALEEAPRPAPLGMSILDQRCSHRAPMPPSASRAFDPLLAAASKASAPQLPRNTDRYVPSHPGRLIHADIADSFKPTHFGSFLYDLIPVDDRLRFKSLYFMKAKSEAPKHTRAFVRKLIALLSTGKTSPVCVGAPSPTT